MGVLFYHGDGPTYLLPCLSINSGLGFSRLLLNSCLQTLAVKPANYLIAISPDRLFGDVNTGLLADLHGSPGFVFADDPRAAESDRPAALNKDVEILIIGVVRYYPNSGMLNRSRAVITSAVTQVRL
jgi:hypothetical protein